MLQRDPNYPAPSKFFPFDLGDVTEASLNSFPKSTMVLGWVTGTAENADTLTGKVKVNWHLRPCTLFKARISFESVGPPDDGAPPDLDNQIELQEEIRRVFADAPVQILEVSLQTGVAVVSFAAPDELDLVLGLGKVAKVGKFAGKIFSLAQSVGARRLARWRAMRIAAGKSPIVGIRYFARLRKAGAKGTYPPGVRRVTDEAEDAFEESGHLAGGGPCFVAGTPVVMADGTTKPIEQVQAGDKVLSRDVKTGKVAAKRVLQTFVHQVNATVALNVGGERIVSTPNHPFYVEGKGFIPAGQLALGTSIITRAGPALKLAGTEPVKAATATLVYNFEVEDFHTYFVGNSGLWVHNLCELPYGAEVENKLVVHRPDGSPITDLDSVIQVEDEYWAVSQKGPDTSDIDTPEDLEKWIKKHIFNPDGVSGLDRYYNALKYGADLPDYLRQAMAQGKLHFGVEFEQGAYLTPEFEKALREAVIRWEIGRKVNVGIRWPWEVR